MAMIASRRIRVPLRRHRRRTTLIGVFALLLTFIIPQTAAHAEEFIRANADWGYAGATFDWAGPGRATNIDLLVSDWRCDGDPVYAVFLVVRTNGGAWKTDTKRWDHSGCDRGDYTSYNNLSVSDDFNIAYLRVYICVRDGGCKIGAESGKNPYA